MKRKFDLTRFLDAQNKLFLTALDEVKNGKKQSHWMWFIFPQLKGLGRSSTAEFYGIDGAEEAMAYLSHPVLAKNLVAISKALIGIEDKTATEIFGSPDDMKLRSGMTLFANMPNANPVFKDVLDKYFAGKPDELTLKILNNDNTF